MWRLQSGLLSPGWLYSQPHYRYHNDTDKRGATGSQAICQATEARPHTSAIVMARHNAGAVLSGWYLCVGDCLVDKLTNSSNVHTTLTATVTQPRLTFACNIISFLIFNFETESFFFVFI